MPINYSFETIFGKHLHVLLKVFAAETAMSAGIEEEADACRAGVAQLRFMSAASEI